MIATFIKNHKEDIIILGVLYSGMAFLSIFIFILHYNPDPMLLLCAFALMLLWIYLVISYQREMEEKYEKKKNKNGKKKSQAYKDFLQDVKEFNEGNFKPSKRGLITVKLGGL